MMPGIPRIHKADIKGNVMADHDGITIKFTEKFKHFFFRFRTPHHVIGDTRQIGGRIRQVKARVNEFLELINDVPFNHLDR